MQIVSRNDKEVIVLIGIHWAVGYDEYVLRTAEFILSLKRLLTFTLGQKIKVILFEDANGISLLHIKVNAPTLTILQLIASNNLLNFALICHIHTSQSKQ